MADRTGIDHAANLIDMFSVDWKLSMTKVEAKHNAAYVVSVRGRLSASDSGRKP